jgi:AICAR transformylase/IMP cyclohydrolase PurH/REP element-mobilizing transposase RayT
MADIQIRRALIAVYDKSGIVEFARALVEEFGIEIISTGGTARHLKEAGIPVTMVEDVTGFPEMLDGRVKTLHPKIHAAILADRDNPEHMRQLAACGIEPIDMVVVNLYPFEKTVADPNCKFEDAIEMIDIGGPCLLRAAAKNHRHVVVLSHSDMYEVRPKLWSLPSFRLEMARRAIWMTGGYDAVIARYLSHPAAESRFSPVHTIRLNAPHSLRYGENPHVEGAAYEHARFEEGDYFKVSRQDGPRGVGWPVDGGPMSYNNYLDADAALALCSELSRAQQALWHRLIAGAASGDAGAASGKAGAASGDAGAASGDAPPAKPNRSVHMQPVRGEQMTRRNLPHIQREDVTYFVTFRLRRGELSHEERDIVMQCCIYPDGKKIRLHAAVVMPDHVHLIFTPLAAPGGGAFSLGDVLHGIKGVSARRIADRRDSRGPVWQDESFDRVIRNGKEFVEKLNDVCENPVAAGMQGGESYPWSICESDPGWSSEEQAAIIESDHSLKCYFDAAVGRGREWHRLLAGATAPGGATAPRAPAICVFVKHTNACGVGVSGDPVEAYRRAYQGDPNAAMGGILAVSFRVDAAFAEAVMNTLARWGKDAGAGAFFVEVFLAPGFDEDAVEVIRTRKNWGQRVRLLDAGDMDKPLRADDGVYRSIAGGMLVQTPDNVGLNEDQWKVATKRPPTESEMTDLRLAWLVAKHTKSNAISICRDGMLIGNGAGQMSRVMSCRIAAWLAQENGHGERLRGAAAASDAFFPFRDGPDILADAGVTAIIQPGGSKRDAETIAACDDRGLAMIFTGTRHFKH